MEADKKKRQQYRIEGNTVRASVPEEWEEESTRPERIVAPSRRYADSQRIKPDRERQRQLRESRERRQEQRLAPQSAAPAIDLLAMIVLVCAMAVTFMVCISYLQVQAQISSQIKETERLNAMTEELVVKNDYSELKLETSLDMEQIRLVAMEELGMVYPYQNQVISYKAGKNGYVRQYGELLGNEQESVLQLMMRMVFGK